MLYPGTIWTKRMAFLVALSTGGINLFINDVQNQVFIIGHEMMVHAKVLSNPVENIAHVMEYNIAPALEYIENSRLSWVIEDYGIPSSQSLKKQIASAHKLKIALETYAPIYTNISLVLKVLNIFFWMPILYSAYWIYQDIRKSSAWIVDVPILLFAVWFNLVSYRYLTDLLTV